jgi:hypothetical protein
MLSMMVLRIVSLTALKTNSAWGKESTHDTTRHTRGGTRHTRTGVSKGLSDEGMGGGKPMFCVSMAHVKWV